MKANTMSVLMIVGIYLIFAGLLGLIYKQDQSLKMMQQVYHLQPSMTVTLDTPKSSVQLLNGAAPGAKAVDGNTVINIGGKNFRIKDLTQLY